MDAIQFSFLTACYAVPAALLTQIPRVFFFFAMSWSEFIFSEPAAPGQASGNHNTVRFLTEAQFLL